MTAPLTVLCQTETTLKCPRIKKTYIKAAQNSLSSLQVGKIYDYVASYSPSLFQQ